MTEIQQLQWIRDNVSPFIRQALTEHRKKNPTLIYCEDWLAAICQREVGSLIAKRLEAGNNIPEIWHLMVGDYTKRPHDAEKMYHGYGCFQADIDSFPDWIKTGDWKDPFKSAYKAILVLEGKKAYIIKQVKEIKGERLERAITAAYNCGEGNVVKLLKAGRPVDTWTTEKNYSDDVFRLRKLYQNLPH